MLYMDGSGDDTKQKLHLLSRDDLESQVRERTAYLENLMDTMVDVLLKLDPNGRISMVNQAVTSVLGYEEDDLEGKPIDFIFADVDDNDSLSKVEFIERLLMNRQLTDVEVYFSTVDGEAIPMSLSASVMESDDERITGMVCVAKDISDRKEAADTAEFLHSLLRHDIGNKLQIVHGSLDIALELDPEDAMDHVETSYQSTDEALELIQNVSTLQQVEGEEDRSVFDIGKIVPDYLEQYEELANRQEMEITVDLADTSPVLAGSLVKELFANLVENALVHSGGSKIQITSVEHADTVEIVVEDDGRGIPEDERERIMQKGVKGRDSSGSGLGTYLTNQIAETYGGTLTVGESADGGARFVIEFEKA